MKKATVVLALAVVAVLAGAAVAKEMDDVKAHPSCPHCGMYRDVYSYSRGSVEYDDGKRVGTCSLRCNVLELSQNPGRKVKEVRIADYDTRELLDPETATWVVGGKKQGVMTRTPKWAFGKREAAEAFIAANGGEMATYATVLSAAKEELGGGGKSGKAPEKGSGCGCKDHQM